jgi:hypothetical protein
MVNVVEQINSDFQKLADEKISELAALLKADLEWLQEYTRAALDSAGPRFVLNIGIDSNSI